MERNILRIFFQKLIDEWIKYSLKDKIETIALFIAMIGAIFTFNEYKTQHDLSISSQLRESDRHINSLILEYPAMDGLWMTSNGNLHGKALANELLLSVINNNSDSWEKKISGWNHISELETILWSADNFYNEEFIKLRQVYMLAEEILYLVTEVLDLEEDDRISDEDVKTYTAYIADLGSHPLFLHAIWYGHQNGYFTPYAAMRLQEEIKKSNDAALMAGEVYKELLSPDWADKLPQ